MELESETFKTLSYLQTVETIKDFHNPFFCVQPLLRLQGFCAVN